MAMEVETRSLLARWIEMEPTPEETDSSVKLAVLPNLVQCGTIEDLLRDIAPQQAHPEPPQCWEDAWKQVLEALDTQSFPYTLSSENPENEGVDCPQNRLEGTGALEELVLDPSFPVEVLPTLSLSMENMWMLQFQLGDDIEGCLEGFEQAASAQHWPREEWVAHLKPHLSPKAFLACSDLGLNVAYDYDVVKASILRHYGITTETRRQCFRQYCYPESKGPREACRKLRTLAWRWLKPEEHTKEQILEQLILEQFLAILPQEMQRRVRECSPETCNQAMDLAESFQLETEPPMPFEDVSVNFSDEEWAILSEEQRVFYQDVMLENFQNVSTLGFPQEKHELIIQIKQGEEADFQDDTITDLPEKESQLTREESSPVPPSEEQPVGKKAVSEKVRTAVKEPTLSVEITEEHSDPFDSFGCKPSIPEKQPPQLVKQSSANMPSVKTQPTKKQTSSPKVRTPQRKKHQPPATGEPAPRTKQAPPSVSREVSGKQKSDDAAISTPKPRKRKKGTPPKGQLPKLKKQAAPVVQLPKLRNKSETQGEPPKLKKELLMPEKTSPRKKNQSQQETGSISTTGNSLVLPSEEQPMEKKAVSKKATPETTSPRKKIQSQQETDSVSTTGNSPVPPSEEQPMEKKAVSKKATQKMPLPPDENAKPHKITIPVITWHPPFSATVVSDLTCLECGRSFRQRADLRHHQYVHTREKPYTCSMCSKCFRHPSHLHIHLRTHSGERPYKCPECGKAFSQSCNLRTHRQIHTGSKPFRCCVCTKSFRHKSNLTIHERVHTGERPYPCSVCPKRFSDRSTLVQHERTHTGERPYACRVCEQRFSQLSHLVKHTRVHPGARGPPKPTRVLAVSPPKNSMSQLNEKDSSLKTTESKQDQNNLAWISKT